MRKLLATLVITSTVLTGCGAVRDSNFNPVNWFGRSQEAPQPQTTDDDVNPLIPTRQGGIFARNRARKAAIDLTTPIAFVTDIVIERVPGGAIIRVTGRDSAEGAFDVELVPETEDETAVDGTLTYTLERQRPARAQPIGTERTRQVTVARALTDQQLEGVRTIQIVAAQNARTVRRR